VDSVSFSDGDVAVSNHIVARGAAVGQLPHSEIAVSARKLRDLLNARAAVFTAKQQITDELVDKVAGPEPGLKHDQAQFTEYAKLYTGASEGEYEVGSGEAKSFIGEVESLRAGDMGQVLDTLNAHAFKFGERKALYENYYSEYSVKLAEESHFSFRLELLRHLAGNIVI